MSLLFTENVCARCGAANVPLTNEQCLGCTMTPQRGVDAILCERDRDKTQERINVRNGIESMYLRLKMLGYLKSHRGIYITEEGDKIAVKVIEAQQPSEYFTWAEHRCG